jgi:ribosome maturation factor RimP
MAEATEQTAGDTTQIICGEIEPIIRGMGFALVELRVGFSHKRTHVVVVVYRSENLGIEDIARLSRVIRPRLDLIDAMENVTLEVSSPGLDRKLRSRKEYEIFKGRGLRLLVAGEKEWRGGIIKDADDTRVVLQEQDRITEIEIEKISKARLDYTQED